MEIQGWSNLPEEVQSWLQILHSQSPPLHVPQPAHLPRTCIIASHTDIHTHTHPHTQSSQSSLPLGRKQLSAVKLLLVLSRLSLSGCWGREERLREGFGTERGKAAQCGKRNC